MTTTINQRSFEQYLNNKINLNEKLKEEQLEKELEKQRQNIDKETEAKWERYKRNNSLNQKPQTLMAVKEHGQPYANNCIIN